MTEGNDVSVNPLRKVVDALTSKNAAVGTCHARRIVVLGHHHREAFDNVVHLQKRKLWVRYDMVVNTKVFAKRGCTLNGRGTIPFDAFVHGSRHDGHIWTLAKEINKSIQKHR